MKRCFFSRAVMALAAVSAVVPAAGQESDQVLKLTLDNAIRIAISENPTIRVAEQQIEVKKISNDESWQSLLPSADFNGQIQYTVLAAEMNLGGQKFKMGKDNTNTWNGQFQISLPIFAPTV